MNNFNRSYKLVIKLTSGDYVIEYKGDHKPFTRIFFHCQKSIEGTLNTMRLKIYNLNENNRNKLLKSADENKRIPFEFYAGYQNTLIRIFKGSVQEGKTYKQNQDWISEINAVDGIQDYLNTNTCKTIKSKSEAVKTLVADFNNIKLVSLSPMQDVTRPIVMVGNTYNILENMLENGQSLFIDQEQLFIINEDEVSGEAIVHVSSETGLMPNLLKKESMDKKTIELTFETVINPMLKIGGACRIESLDSKYDGVYKITSIEYLGDTNDNKWSQTCTGLLYG